ncbi:hypothetical protein [Agromyces sp. NPDC056965]|uniref:DUF7882 family protein n=1 Tax=Agromyces sp. NPDC056965 TaxID=3345983 RepID=UPI003640CB10
MGKLLYGPKIVIDLDDQNLFHLDVLIARLRGESFQLHLTAGGAHDGSLLSLAIGPGVSLSMEYYNGPELSLELDVIDKALGMVQSHGFVTVPFTFKRHQEGATGA